MTDNITKLLTDAVVLDTETTSLDFKIAEVIQYASASVQDILETVGNETYEVAASFYKSNEPIKPEVSAVNGITNRMVAGSEEFSKDVPFIQTDLNRFSYYIAHNAAYDAKILERYGLKLPTQICTMRMAKKLYEGNPNITAFKLGHLRYALDLPIDDNIVAHRADDDVIVTGILFVELLSEAIKQNAIDPNKADLGQQIVDWINEPIITTIMPFGKHKGEKLTSIPLSYWQWALDSMDCLQESKPEYDKDFAASVAKAVEEIFEGRQ